MQATFGLIAGPLTWSIVALQNSLVLHSLDQVIRPSEPYAAGDQFSLSLSTREAALR